MECSIRPASSATWWPRAPSADGACEAREGAYQDHDLLREHCRRRDRQPVHEVAPIPAGRSRHLGQPARQRDDRGLGLSRFSCSATRRQVVPVSPLSCVAPMRVWGAASQQPPVRAAAMAMMEHMANAAALCTTRCRQPGSEALECFRDPCGQVKQLGLEILLVPADDLLRHRQVVV